MAHTVNSVLVFVILFLSTLCLASDVSFKEVDTLIANNKVSEATAIVDKKLVENPNDKDLLMRKSRLITLQGDQAKEEDQKVQHYEEAQKIADKIVEMWPQSATGYVRRAVAKGKLILFKGILQSRTLILELRADANKALEVNKATDYEKALANYLLGKAHLKLAQKPKALRLPLGLAWANKKDGGKHLRLAAELSPNSIPFNLDYGMWLRENGKNGEGKKYVEKIDSLEIKDPADSQHKETAKQALVSW